MAGVWNARGGANENDKLQEGLACEDGASVLYTSHANTNYSDARARCASVLFHGKSSGFHLILKIAALDYVYSLWSYLNVFRSVLIAPRLCKNTPQSLVDEMHCERFTEYDTFRNSKLLLDSSKDGVTLSPVLQYIQ
jgi:hypothetical protein